MGYNTHPVNPSFRVARNFSACSKREGKRFSNFPSSRSKFFSPLGSKKTKRCTIAYKRAALFFFFFFISLISCAARRETFDGSRLTVAAKKRITKQPSRGIALEMFGNDDRNEREREELEREDIYTLPPPTFFSKRVMLFSLARRLMLKLPVSMRAIRKSGIKSETRS